MFLPNGSEARIDPAKLREYLLSSSHPIGRFKHPFFAGLGYSKERWQRLETDLLELAATGVARMLAKHRIWSEVCGSWYIERTIGKDGRGSKRLDYP